VNILHLTPYYAPAYAFGGVTRAVEGMARSLVARGHIVTVLTTDALSQHQRYTGVRDEIREGVRVVRVPNRSVWLRGRFNLSTPLGMGEVVEPLLAQADVLHVHEFRTAENLLVLPVAARHGTPVALSPHGTLTRSTGRGALKLVWDRLLSPNMARHISTVIGLTVAEAAEAKAAWESFGIDLTHTQFAVVPNGVDMHEFDDPLDASGGSSFRSLRAPFRQRFGIAEDAPVCLFMGRLQARKGVDVLARAFRQADVAGARLVIAGPDEGMMVHLQPVIDQRITLAGFLSGADRLAALAAADVFCLPARGEGLSMASLEALAAGLPVILSPGCNLPEAAEAGAGVIVEPQVEPLAAALSALLRDPARRAAMGVAAQRLARERFTWEAVAAGLESVYTTITNSS
jgi:glycosyltransferase involved in cell wall biosynthesis